MEDFEQLYLENFIIIQKYLHKLGCPPQDAEDIIQETFVQALLHIRQFKGDSKISVWLCKIARNLWYNQLKKEKNKVMFEKIELLGSVEHDYLIEECLKYVPEPYQSVFMMRTIKGYEFSEIAEKYHKSESWARVTYHRAKIKYRELFKEEEEK